MNEKDTHFYALLAHTRQTY